MKVTLRELIYDYAGGIRDGRALKAVIPGGSSVPILLPDQLDIEASFDGVAKAGSLLGSAGIIVLDDTTCMVWLAENLLRFYRHESCGKCTPCREGTQWVLNILEKIERGEGEMKDLALLENVAGLIAGKTLCAFGDAAATPALTTLKNFRGEYEAHMREGRCTVPAPWRRRHAAPGGVSLTLDLTSTMITRRDRAARDPGLRVLHAAQLGRRHGVRRAEGRRENSAAHGADARRSVRPAAAARRHHQAGDEGESAAEVGRSDSLRAGARSFPRRRRSSAFAVVPFGAETTFFGLLDQPVPLQVADVNVAILWVFAVASMGVYGIVLAGWSSNSKYSLLGALRSSAQMISYELSYGMALAAVLLLAGSMSIREIVDAQAGAWFGFIPRWFVFLQPVGFFIFMTAGVAETNRAPFDFPEAEQELVAGYHTEYSSMSFAMFFLAEYINMVTVSAIATNLYLGGWHGPFLPVWLGWIWFLLKLSFLLFFYVWMRWTLPRYRYDQLMAFGWKFLLPLSVINLLVTAAGVLYFGL